LLALDGGHSVQVIRTTNVPVAISGLTVRNGNGAGTNGGGIYASGALTLTQVTLFGNSADYGGGVFATGNTRVTDSVFENNNATQYDGGGMYAGGRLRMSGSQFYNNRTLTLRGYGGGGGLMAFGRTTITSTNFISNTTTNWGGGAYIANFADHTAVHLTDSQFTNNRAQFGGGGGLFNWFTATLSTVDFVNNYSEYYGGGVYSGYGGNYRQTITGGQMVGNSGAGGGGLYSDSNYTLDSTQVLSNTARNGNGGGAWTPRNAVVSNAYIAHNTVLTGGNSGGIDTGHSITLTNSTLFDNRTLTGSGGGSGAGSNATVVNTHYISNTAQADGGGLLAYGTARVTNSSFFSNTTGNLGGAILTSYAFLDSNQIEDNHALNNWGGGLYAHDTATLTDTNVLRNTSKYAGGGIAVQFGNARVTGGRFESNQAGFDGWGGAIYTGGPSLTISGTQFYTNTAQTTGGAVAANSITIVNATYSGNSSGGTGGAVTGNGPLNVSLSLFQQNSSVTDGGAIYANSTINLQRTQFLANQANRGGAIFMNAGSGSIVNALFARNHALSTAGEALALNPTGTLSIQHSTFASPTLAGGSAILLNSGILELLNSIVAMHSLGIVEAAGSVSANYNLFYGNLVNTTGGSVTNNHPISGNPSFFNPGQDDYHLGAGSAAVNAGPNIGVLIDFDGEVRPQGSAFDLGYDEVAPPEGLTASNDGPTVLGHPTTFSASITFGRAVTFHWDFGDGNTGDGNPVTHTYASPGVYHTTVTASNGAGSLSASTTVTVTPGQVYLPILRR
jgi:predicted outer membrane repeat protein